MRSCLFFKVNFFFIWKLSQCLLFFGILSPAVKIAAMQRPKYLLHHHVITFEQRFFGVDTEFDLHSLLHKKEEMLQSPES